MPIPQKLCSRVGAVDQISRFRKDTWRQANKSWNSNKTLSKKHRRNHWKLIPRIIHDYHPTNHRKYRPCDFGVPFWNHLSNTFRLIRVCFRELFFGTFAGRNYWQTYATMDPNWWTNESNTDATSMHFWKGDVVQHVLLTMIFNVFWRYERSKSRSSIHQKSM